MITTEEDKKLSCHDYGLQEAISLFLELGIHPDRFSEGTLNMFMRLGYRALKIDEIRKQNNKKISKEEDRSSQETSGK